MKTDEIKVTQDAAELAKTPDKIELIALYADMARREAASMRLLTGEMLSAISDILKVSEGSLWMVTEEQTFSLHLRVEKPYDKTSRDKLIALSTSGETSAPKGLFRKLGHVMGKLLLGDEDSDVSLGITDYMMLENSMTGMTGVCTYRYIPHIAHAAKPAEPAPQPEDELVGIEKRIIDAIVDDVLVTMQGNYVELVAVKNLNK